jgi:hypothetical protein
MLRRFGLLWLSPWCGWSWCVWSGAVWCCLRPFVEMISLRCLSTSSAVSATSASEQGHVLYHGCCVHYVWKFSSCG